MDCFGEVVVARDMPVSFEFPSLDSCQKRFLWTHKEAGLAPHPVVGIVPHVRNAARFHQAPGLSRLPRFRSSDKFKERK